MATFTADSSGSDMMLLFSWVDGSTPISSIEFAVATEAQVKEDDQSFPPDGSLLIL